MIVNEINIKLIIVGDGGVGKTSMVNALVNKNIPEVYIPTIGSNITKKEFHLQSINLDLRLNLWDLGGQRSFNPLNPAFFKNVDAAFLVFDIAKPETLNELENVYLNHLRKNSEECIIFLVGNKLDLISDPETLKRLTRNFPIKEIPIVFTSARTRENLEEIFELLAFSYLQEMMFKYPDDKLKGLDNEFLETIKKTEIQLRNLFINSENVESITLQKTPTAPITKKVVETNELIDEKEKDIILIREKLRRLDLIKSQIISSFNNNLSVIENIFNKLKKTPIDSLLDSLDNAIGQIEYFKEDFELKLESLLDTGLESLVNLEDEPI
ncbi:MAG: GTP-binding protein [Candidatus Lokiarchaeota archaeon]|nr:GTP-binding protein [Candidatus Lokiarchaeota archaeon]